MVLPGCSLSSTRVILKQNPSMSAILVYDRGCCYAMSIATSTLVVGFTGGHESAFIGLAYLSSMFLPAVSVLIVGVLMNEAPRVSWGRFPLRYLPVALFLIPGVLHAVMLPLMALTRNGAPGRRVLFTRRLHEDGVR